MKYAVLDTNFILSCIRKKIDFFEEIQLMGFKILIPMQVIREIKKFAESKPEARLALTLINKNDFDEIDLKLKNADNGIVNLAEKNRDYVIATLDREIKSRVKNPKLVIRGNKKLEIV